MITFSWKVLNMRSAGGTVQQVWFLLTGTDSDTGQSQGTQGSISLLEPEEGGEYTYYDDLTEDQVAEWLDASPHAEDFKKRVMESLKEPEPDTPVIAALPWASAE